MLLAYGPYSTAPCCARAHAHNRLHSALDTLVDITSTSRWRVSLLQTLFSQLSARPLWHAHIALAKHCLIC